MKKVEAQEIAIERSKLILEYITQILSESEKVSGSIEFSSAKIDNQKMCTVDIFVSNGFERHFNLGITTDHDLVLYEQLLNDLLDSFLEHETMGVSRYYSIKSMQEEFSGINAVNTIGSKIKINFKTTSPEFVDIISKYTKRIDEYTEFINNGHITR